jgi:hypothetical protein
MYRTFEEEVFLAPETIISGVLEAAAFDDLRRPAGWEPNRQSGHAAAAASDTDDGNADADNVEPVVVRRTADPIDAWSRHACGANGFGG